MPTRARAIAVAALILSVGACAGGQPPTRAPSTPTSPAGPRSPTPVPTESASPAPILGCMPDAPPPAPADDEVIIWFTCRGTQAPGRVGWTIRPIAPGADAEERLRTALAELLRGPNEAEAEAGMTSWFSPATDGALLGVTIGQDEVAVIDFADFSPTIPNASTSAGSAMLLAELNATVFQLPDVAAALYRFDGDCEAFWNWLQAGCRVVPRP